jgi:hypothetical protein
MKGERMPKTKIQQKNAKTPQLYVNIPKREILDRFGWVKGDKIDWTIHDDGSVTLRKEV